MTQQLTSIPHHPVAPGSAEHVTMGHYSPEVVPFPAGRAGTRERAGLTIAAELNGPLTALMLYMGEIKHHSDKIGHSPGERLYLQTIVENALAQTERVCALVKQISGLQNQLTADRGDGAEANRGLPANANSTSRRFCKALTPREREVLKLIAEGHSNKQGALCMSISPRTFESHRAEAMRKLGARNTAELVRAALLQPLD